MIGELDQRLRGDDLHLRARPSGFRSARERADQALAARIGADRGRQHARDRRDRAVETELAEHREARDRVVRDRADRRHQAERDRQVVMAALLGQIRRREVDDDAPGRQRKPGGDERAAHPLTRLRHRLVGQADDDESRQARRDTDLDVDRAGLDALESDGGNALHHMGPRTSE
jgi:hypothetical protein